MKTAVLLILALVAISATAEVFFQEKFDNKWRSRWVDSKSKGNDAGQWIHSTGKFYRDVEDDKGIQTSEDYRFYQISSAFPEFSNKGKTLVLQFSVKHEQNLDCGGGYIKILPAGVDQENFNGDSPYNIMFGPDICGTSTRRIHAIINYKGENHLIKQNIPCESDTYTHVYTFIINPDQTYQILVDNVEKASGSITEDWDVLPPKQIKDPNVSKPDDWVDQARIPDPSAVKPDGWDDILPMIEDPEAVIPDDWDTELDGEWEPPLVPNPEYKGEWRAPMIDNPDYKGPWEHPLIDNPEYYYDDEIYAFDSNGLVGIEIWQVKSGSIFDNILITDDVALAHAEADKISFRTEAEKEMQQAESERRMAQEEEERARLEAEFDEFEEEEEVVGHGHSHDEL